MDRKGDPIHKEPGASASSRLRKPDGVMAKSNLATRLSKELRRSPKKSAVLALMGVVALWFWAPLVWKWVAPESSAAALATSANSAAAVVTSTSPGTVIATQPSAPALSWKELAALLQEDPLLAASQSHETIIDPFAVPAVAAASEETAEGEKIEEGESSAGAQSAKTEAPLVRPTPEQLGLTLTSTIAGGRRAVATINGKTCRVGDVIVVPSANMQYEFSVISINTCEVTLAAGDESFVLPAAQLKSTMQLIPTATATRSEPSATGGRIVVGTALGE